MNSNLRKVVLTVRGKSGSHRQTYYLANKQIPVRQGHTVPTTVQPTERIKVSYGLVGSKDANRGVDHALWAIGRVHSVPKGLYAIEVGVVRSLGGSEGTYWSYAPGGRHRIEISRGATEPSMVMAHEYGHFLDHHLFGNGDGRGNLSSFASHQTSNHETKALMRSIYRSEAVRTLVKKAVKARNEADHGEQRITDYLLTPTELFARSYAQWIGLRSGSGIIRRQLRERDAEGRQYGYPTQWTDRDFLPIAREFDRLFARRGLLRKQ